MRFLLLMFAAAAVGLACEKDPALSKSTNNLAPSPDTTSSGTASSGIASDTTAPRTIALPATAPAAVDPSGVGPRIAAPAAEVAPNVIAVEGAVKATSAQQLTKPGSVADEGNGEPMDDVDDDEVIPATDKSGVDEPVDDDSDGVGIDIRQ
jgi:hypothetical protein